MKNLKIWPPTLFVFLLLTFFMLSTAYGQITPSGDAYTNTALPTTNFGTKTVLDVESASQTTYIQFDLSSIPAGYTSANVAKASLKLYVNAVITAGSFNVNFVNGTWSEKTITANLSPALGATIAASVPLTSSNVHDYVIIDVTSAVGAWLNGSQANDGIALVANSPLNASFDSKENTTNSQTAELEVVLTGTGTGTITGVTTATGSGLTGGGTKGTLALSLTNGCAANQVLQWNGSAWVCASAGAGTITGVTAGTDLTGGGTSGNVTLNLNTATTDGRYAQLAAANTFTKNNSFAGTVGIGTTVPSAQLDVEAPATAATGIQGVTSSTSFFSAGIFGHATGTSGVTRGVYGVSDSPSGIGVHGIAQIGGQFETGNGTIFVGRGQGANRVTIDSLGNTATTGGVTAAGAINAGGAVSAGGGLFASVTGGTTAVFANSDTGTGVFGGGAIGVLGSSTSGDGVHGVNGSGASGVAGINNGSGQGLYGAAMGSSGQGVHGESFATGASNGYGPDGVDGITHSANGSGVAGVNDAPGGTGVYGVSTNGGFGFVTPSNVQQGRGMGGWAKALVFVDPFTSSGTAITRCYNSQASGATVWTPPCGISITHAAQGVDILDFGYQVNDRYVSMTPFAANGVGTWACVLDPDNACLPGVATLTANQIGTVTAFDGGNGTDIAFWIIVF